MTLVRRVIGRQPFLVPIERSVTGSNHSGICPTINLHGIGFRAVLPGRHVTPHTPFAGSAASIHCAPSCFARSITLSATAIASWRPATMSPR
jgi:hypothetical protein